MKSLSRSTPLLVALFVLLMALVALLWNSPMSENRRDGGGSAQSLPGFPADGAINPGRTHTPAPAIMAVNPQPPHEKIVRGPNNTLLFDAPWEVERRTVPGRAFLEPFLKLRDKDAPGPLSLTDHSFSAVDAAYDPNVVHQFIASDADHFTLPLSGDKRVDVRVDQTLSRGRGTYSLIGKVADEPLSDVLLVAHDGALFGNVVFYNTNTHYELAVSGDGDIAIRHLDPRTYDAPCGDPGPEVAADAIAVSDAPAAELPGPPIGGAPEEEGAEEADPMILIDAVVGYGIEARQAEGNTAAMEARIIASVDRTNLAFGNSQVTGVQFVLLGTVQDPAYDFPGLTAGVMGSADELGDLNAESDGILDTVTNLKNAVGADQATFIVKETDGSAGVAYRPGDSAIVARTYMTSTRITFVHELGHNIGCRHAWGDTDSLLTNHNYGWRIKPPGSSQVRTVMAYNWGWTRIPYFSNPDVLYNGAKTGTVNGYNATGDSTADPAIVSGGYDGSNPNLGARNAHYILANAENIADNLDRPAPDIQLEQPANTPLVNSPSTSIALNAQTINDTALKTFTIRNVGNANLDSLAVSLQGAESGAFNLGPLGATTVAPNGTTTFNVSFTATDFEAKTALLRVTSNDTDDSPFEVTLDAQILAEIELESFETGLGAWTNAAGNDLDWRRDSNGTPSSGTGPSTAANGSFYLYTEATGNFNETARIEATFDFSGLSGVWIDFAYHMYGSNMGTLWVDVFDGTWHLDEWSLSGQQQSSNGAAWQRTVVDLSAYAGKNSVTIRFRGLTGPSYQSDMAIDDIMITGEPLTHTLTYTAGSGGTLTGDISQIVVDGGDGTAVEAMPNETFIFTDWSDGSTQNPRTDTGVSADISVQANFSPEPSSTFGDWAGENSLSGGDADPLSIPLDDGMSNLLKYGFNLPLLSPTPPRLIPTTGTSGLPYIWLPPGPSSTLSVEYIRRKAPTDISYQVEFSSELTPASWTGSGTEQSVTSIDENWERVIVVDSVPQSSAERRFARVRLELTSP